MNFTHTRTKSLNNRHLQQHQAKTEFAKLIWINPITTHSHLGICPFHQL